MTACWIWIGTKNLRGYGVKWFCTKGRRRSVPVHRLVWEALHGQIPSWADLHHLCAVKACYRPSHLMLLSRLAHLYIETRGVGVCKLGHPYDPQKRGCRACQREARKKRYHLNPEVFRARSLRWRDNNRERKLQYQTAYAAAHPEIRAAYLARTRERRKIYERERSRIRRSKQRERRLEAGGGVIARSRRTSCANGHPFDKTVVASGGRRSWRECSICRRAYKAAWERRRRTVQLQASMVP